MLNIFCLGNVLIHSLYKPCTNLKPNFGLAAQEQNSNPLKPGLRQDLPGATGIVQTVIGSVLESSIMSYCFSQLHILLYFFPSRPGDCCA